MPPPRAKTISFLHSRRAANIGMNFQRAFTALTHLLGKLHPHSRRHRTSREDANQKLGRRRSCSVFQQPANL